MKRLWQINNKEESSDILLTKTNEISSNNIINRNCKLWLYYNKLSCRYETYLLIQLYIFNKIIDDLKYKCNSEANKLYVLADSIDNLPEEEYKKGFWELLKLYNLDTINALDTNNGFKE